MAASIPPVADATCPDEPLRSYGPITDLLMQARKLADSELILLRIDTALMLVRQAHRRRMLAGL